MILYWDWVPEGSDVNMLPYPMDTEQASNFVWGWLQHTTPKNEDDRPIHPSSEKGWELTSQYHNIYQDACAYIIIIPVWFT